MRVVVGYLLAICVATSPHIASADDAAPKPWAIGVSDEEQAAALKLYEEGNAEFQAARFQQALAKYREALSHWDHPAIHFNAAVCLINLDNPLEAKDHLEKALQYGEDALGTALYAQGLTYRHSLDGQIARVRITCKEPDAVVTLDGRKLFIGPGEAEQIVLPGKHQVVATKPGFMPASETLDLVSAKLNTHDVHLIALKTATRYERRWPRWQPLSLAGTGVAVVGLGGLTYYLASNQFAAYDSGITSHCPHGCDSATLGTLGTITDHQHRGDVEQDISFALFALGGAAIAVGVAAVIYDQPRARTEHSAGPTLAPAPGGGATLSWSGRF